MFAPNRFDIYCYPLVDPFVSSEIRGENNFHCSSDRMGFIVDRMQLARELDVWIYRHERNERSFTRRETEITKNIEEPEIVDLKIELRTINFQGIVKILFERKEQKNSNLKQLLNFFCKY